MGDDWLARAVRPGGHLVANTGCETSFHSIQEAIVKLGIDYSHDKLITKLSFGFWIFQFAAKQFAASGNTLLQIFVNRPYGLTQKEVFGKLIKMNQIRNKIAHQRSMCFDRDKISISEAELCYKITVEILTWLGCNPRRILYGIDNVQNAINIIKVIQSRVAK